MFYIFTGALFFVIAAVLTIRSREQVFIFAIISVATAALLTFMFRGDFHSYEILSGVITSKKRETVSCQHSYSCNCDSKGNCSTCYEHINDYDWVVKTNINDKGITIDRVDRQGVLEPQRFTEVVIGENAFIKQSYQDYFKMSKGNVIHSENIKNVAQQGIDLSHIVYPDIYDYYRVNRVIFDGSSLPIDSGKVNDLMVLLNPAKQVNLLVFVISDEVDIDTYLMALRETLYGGRKNDIVLIVQAKDNEIADARVFSRSSNKMIDETLPEAIKGVVPFDNDAFIEAISENVKEHFQREDFEQYSFMATDIEIGFKYFAVYFAMLGLLITFLVKSSGEFSVPRFNSSFGRGRKAASYRSRNSERRWNKFRKSL